ncbi:MAG: hypothetical protein HQL64_02545 [Magnetococcales bacterium]|nr:hypothetical protein [Magnetococcales bacterium]
MAFIIHSGRSNRCPGLKSAWLASNQDLSCTDATTMDLHFAHRLAHHSRMMFKPVQRIFRETSIHQVIRNICTESIGAMVMSPSLSRMNWPGNGSFQEEFALHWSAPQTLQ